MVFIENGGIMVNGEFRSSPIMPLAFNIVIIRRIPHVILFILHFIPFLCGEGFHSVNENLSLFQHSIWLKVFPSEERVISLWCRTFSLLVWLKRSYWNGWLVTRMNYRRRANHLELTDCIYTFSHLN